MFITVSPQNEMEGGGGGNPKMPTLCKLKVPNNFNYILPSHEMCDDLFQFADGKETWAFFGIEFKVFYQKRVKSKNRKMIAMFAFRTCQKKNFS